MAVQQFPEPLDEIRERFGREQVWVQCGRRGSRVPAGAAYSAARDMMREMHKQVAALHVSECEVAKSRVCNCEPYIVFVKARA